MRGGLEGTFFAVLVVVFGAGALAWGWLWVRSLAGRLEAGLGAPPQRTVWEWLFSLASSTPQEIALTEQRAARGTAAAHPMGSRDDVHWLDRMAFRPGGLDHPAQTAEAVHTGVRLGPMAPRPLCLSLPVLVAPMAWGLSLTTEAKIALAQASQAAGTAVVSGEGPVLVEEVAWAGRWILQVNRGQWAHQRALVRLADAVEVQVGQAAEGSGAVVKHRRSLPRRVRRALARLSPVVIRAGLPRPLPVWLRALRAANPEVPLGVKIPAGPDVAQDVVKLARWGVDFITLEGAEAATASSPAVIHDHFGIPLAVAVRAADRALKAAGLRHRVSLVAAGGIRGAADAAKVLALGADAVAVGTSLLFALAHRQVTGVLPWHAPTALVFPSGSGQAQPLDADMAFLHASKWFLATRLELALVAATVGEARLSDLGPHHLTAYDSEVARALDLDELGAAPADRLRRRLLAVAEGYQDLGGLYSSLAALLGP
ncbi:MAG: alpha-hydroxy-acid oxidizing protein [Firmicutes bacterium]|nr:alpha-hydroxy-acid oxidizing protein [Alicyclobacillaceae bacterium]MCL6496207.1 alpha-hydroxy-acid oxidizing protein [Bacillota bacterium]